MIKIIVAMSENQIIGKNNKMPWNNKEDMNHFRLTTQGHAVVMGRKTFESLNQKALPNRINYVLTSNKDYRVDNSVILIHDIASIITEFELSEKILFVIGGSEIYKLFLPFCCELIISIIPGVYEGDTYFPEFKSMFHLFKIVPMNSFVLHYYERSH